MIKLSDSLKLATTKLRVRRIRLIVTLVVAGILFMVLVAGSLLVRGTIHSLESFSSEGLLGRFIVSTFPAFDYDLSQDSRYIKRAEELDKQRLDAQTKEAKRLGIEFSPATAPKAVNEFGDPGHKQKVLDMQQPPARQAFTELTPNDLRQRTTSAAAPYHPLAVYEGFRFGAQGAGGGDSYEFSAIVKNEEQKPTPLGAGGYGLRDSLKGFQSSLSATDNGLLKAFLLEGAEVTSKSGEPIPILAPIDAAETFLGLTALPRDASPDNRIDRLRQVRSSAKNLTFDVCYRNGAALELRAKAASQAEELAAHKADKDYQKPSLLYGSASAACQSTPITVDTRTAAEKQHDAKQEQFDRTFGAVAPVTSRITFRIVGILPQLGSLTDARGPEGLISVFFTSSLGEGWFMSREAAVQHPILGQIVRDPLMLVTGSQSFYVELPDRPTQKRFLDEQGCEPSINPADCVKAGKLPLNPFGNPLTTLYDLSQGFNDFLRIALGIIALLSAIVLMGTIGKVVADSRKETSVFRAVGAKRFDIAQIYLSYTAILATLSFLVALGLGLGAALFLELSYSPGLSAAAVLAFNAHDLDKTFHLIGLQPLDLLLVYAFILVVSLVSATIPLLLSLRRNPVKDMREE